MRAKSSIIMIIAMFLFGSVAQAELDVKRLWWKLDGDSVDSSGANGSPGNVASGISWTNDSYSGQAAYGSGASPSLYYNTGITGNFHRDDESDPLAIDFRFSITNGVDSGDMLYYGSNTTKCAVGFTYGTDAGRHVGYEFKGNLNGGGYEAGWLDTGTVLNNSGWHHVSFTYANDTVIIKIDGIEKLNMDWPYGILNPAVSANTPFRLFTGSNRRGPFNGGLIDEVIVSTAHHSPVILRDVQLKWKFEGDYTDSSGKGLTGTASGTSFTNGYSGQTAWGTATTPSIALTSGGNFGRNNQDDPLAIDFYVSTAGANGDEGDILSYGSTTYTGCALNLAYRGTGGSHGLTYWFMGDLNGGQTCNVTAYTRLLNPVGWHHISFLYQDAHVTIEVDSETVVDMDWPYGIRNPTLSPSSPFLIMASVGRAGSFNGGMVDEVTVSTFIPEGSVIVIR